MIDLGTHSTKRRLPVAMCALTYLSVGFSSEFIPFGMGLHAFGGGEQEHRFQFYVPSESRHPELVEGCPDSRPHPSTGSGCCTRALKMMLLGCRAGTIAESRGQAICLPPSQLSHWLSPVYELRIVSTSSRSTSIINGIPLISAASGVSAAISSRDMCSRENFRLPAINCRSPWASRS